MKRLLLTRPRYDSEILAPLLKERGWDVVIEPILDVTFYTLVPLDLRGVAAFLVTSANGVRALERHNAPRRIPVFAVGQTTGDEAKRAGFTKVGCAAGDVESLVRLVKKVFDPDMGVLLHAAGLHRAGDLVEDLSKAGYRVRRAVLYEAHTAKRFSKDLIERMVYRGEKAIDGIAFFSPRTAQTFANLMDRHDLTPLAQTMTAYCLSAAVARPIERLPWRDVVIAEKPERIAFLNVLAKAAAKRRR